jgi:microcystin degradation protein MlrC
MRIAVGGIHTECSTYSPLLQTVADFQVTSGSALLEQAGVSGTRFPGATFLPLFHARAIPGGPVSIECYNTFKRAFLDALEATLPVDGVLLIMHGAMHVPGMDDVEGDWISSVRQLVGPEPPIAVSYDLHGNVTQKILDQIDIFCAYRTAPHTDVKETHLRAAENLVDQLRGGERRLVAWAPVPVLLPGERTSTEVEPAASLYRNLLEVDTQPGVSDANLMIGYVWADTARATAAAVITGTEPGAVLSAAGSVAMAYWSARRALTFDVPTKSLAECLAEAKLAETRPFVIADSGDNPTGGGVGDRADVLQAWLQQGLKGAVFAAIADPNALDQAWNLPKGETVSLSIGGALGSDCPRATTQAVPIKRLGSRQGGDREILIEAGGNKIVLTERRRPFHALADFRRFDMEPLECRYLIVKSGYLSPELAPIANPPRMALTDGAVNQNIPSLTNTNRALPCFPFQDNFEWSPVARLSARAGFRGIQRHETPKYRSSTADPG